jgi:hypothetical protein
MSEWLWITGPIIRTEETEVVGEETILEQICPPQIPHELAWA